SALPLVPAFGAKAQKHKGLLTRLSPAKIIAPCSNGSHGTAVVILCRNIAFAFWRRTPNLPTNGSRLTPMTRRLSKQHSHCGTITPSRSGPETSSSRSSSRSLYTYPAEIDHRTREPLPSFSTECFSRERYCRDAAPLWPPAERVFFTAPAPIVFAPHR